MAPAQKLNILDLPDELLVQIFDSLAPNRFLEDEYVFPREPRSTRALQHARLTCRRFCSTSSHLLIDAVYVDMRLTSLHRLEDIAAHQAIGRGVRLVCIALSVWSPETAEMLSDYIAAVRAQVSGRKEYVTPVWRLHTRSTTFGNNSLEWSRGMRFMSVLDEAYASITLAAFREFEPEALALLSRLEDDHETYFQHHREFEQVRQSGTFATRVCQAVARLPSARHFHLSDSICLGQQEPGYLRTETIDALGYQPASPTRWSLQNWADIPFDVPWQLAKELSCRRIAPTSYTVNISVFRLPVEYDPHSNDPARFDDERFVARSLCAFHYGPPELTAADTGWQNRNVATVPVPELNNERSRTGFMLWLRAWTSSSKLRTIRLDLGAFRRKPGEANEPDLDIGPLLTGRSWPTLREIHLTSARFHLSALELFLDGLATPPSQLTFVLSKIKLLSGTWAAALDVLHSKSPHDWYIEDIEPGNNITEHIEFGGAIAHRVYGRPDAGYACNSNTFTSYVRGVVDHNPMRYDCLGFCAARDYADEEELVRIAKQNGQSRSGGRALRKCPVIEAMAAQQFAKRRQGMSGSSLTTSEPASDIDWLPGY